LTFVSESSFDRRWVSRLVDYIAVVSKPNVTRKRNLNGLKKTANK